MVGSEIAITVEGNPYSVLPYLGYFIPLGEDLPDLVEINYERQTGRITSNMHGASSTFMFEDRLVSYHLEN